MNLLDVGDVCSITLLDNFVSDKSIDAVEKGLVYDHMSLLDKLISWLISIHYIPVKKSGQYSFSFKIFSNETFVTVLIFSGMQVVIFSLQISTFILLLEYSFNRSTVRII
jgi:hypothetical protein